MTPRVIPFFVLILCGMVYGAEPLPSQDDINKTFESGDYSVVLTQLNRVLPLRGKASAGYDRYRLLMLKGETHLRLKQFKTAGDVFGAAAKETRNEVDAAIARVTQKLVREARGPEITRNVVRKDETLKKASLLDPRKRHDALSILYDDMRAAAEPKIKEATRARTIPPIGDALKLLSELRDFELAGIGENNAASHDDARDKLGARAHTLIAKELDRIERDVTAIHENANEVISESTRTSLRSSIRGVHGGTSNYGEGSAISTIYRGLSGQDKSDLQGMIDTAGKILITLDDLSRTQVGNPNENDRLSDRTKTLRSETIRVLRIDYNGRGVRR